MWNWRVKRPRHLRAVPGDAPTDGNALGRAGQHFTRDLLLVFDAPRPLWGKVFEQMDNRYPGMVRQGVVFAGIDADWVMAVLGAMLLAAVLVNRYVRQRALGARS